VILLAAAASSARNLEIGKPSVLPSGSTGVIVLDVSLSITDGDYAQVRRLFRGLISADAEIGLVIFSDVPYELLPPGTPARELRPLLRLLVPPRADGPANPWVESFRLGTRISPALVLARKMLEREQVKNRAILLVSDLQTAPDDVLALTRTVEHLRRQSIALRIAPLSPQRESRRLFEGLLGEDAFAAPSRAPVGQSPPSKRGTGLPMGLLVLSGLFFGILAANERFTGRLALPRAPRFQRARA
jgi:hypothetical protein